MYVFVHIHVPSMCLGRSMFQAHCWALFRTACCWHRGKTVLVAMVQSLPFTGATPSGGGTSAGEREHQIDFSQGYQSHCSHWIWQGKAFIVSILSLQSSADNCFYTQIALNPPPHTHTHTHTLYPLVCLPWNAVVNLWAQQLFLFFLQLATWLDSSVSSVSSHLEQKAQHFSELSGESITFLHVSELLSAVVTETGKIYWWWATCYVQTVVQHAHTGVCVMYNIHALASVVLRLHMSTC